MSKKTQYTLLILLLSILFSSCKEKEKELEASPDLLAVVRKNEFSLKLEDESQRKAIEAELEKAICFAQGEIYEMKANDKKEIHHYSDLESYRRGKVLDIGTYLFSETEHIVSFSFLDEDTSYLIDGYFGNSFYKHFVGKEGAGEANIVEASKIFCLHHDIAAELALKYPTANITEADIKADMMTIRRLETTK